MKLTIRILPLLKSYMKEKGKTPTKMVACIHEIFHFLLGNVEVQIDEISKAAIEQIHIKRIAADEKITLLLKEENIWGEDLTQWIKI
jgi:mannitol-1-phosphate/altronate dehydrogenase